MRHIYLVALLNYAAYWMVIVAYGHYAQHANFGVRLGGFAAISGSWFLSGIHGKLAGHMIERKRHAK